MADIALIVIFVQNNGDFVLGLMLRTKVTPQTVMRVEFHPASNMAEHGKWRLYGMPIDNIEVV